MTAKTAYLIAPSDFYEAQRYLHRKLTLNLFWIEDNQASITFDVQSRDLVTLNQWCQQWLSPEQWRQMKAALRARRHRARRQISDQGANHHVSLTRPAWVALRALAKRDGVTLSEFILRHHYQAWIDMDD